MSSNKKTKKGIIRRGMPANPSITVKSHQFKRASGSRLVSTTTVSTTSRSSVPFTFKMAHGPLDDPVDDQQLYSDVEEELLEKATQKEKKKKKKKGSSRSVNALLEDFFRNKYDDEFMDELAWSKSSSQLTCLPQCTSCSTPQAMFRCIDCFAESLFCQQCLVSFHRREPFHHLQRWTGTYFTRASPRELGAVYQLGHNHGSSCAIPSSRLPLTIFDITGVYTIDVTYCECESDGSSVPSRIQLLRARWFPATWQRLSTAFTFRLLNFLHKLHTTCKVNLYDFHTAITDVCNNSGNGKPVFRYNELSLVFRIYVHLRQLRRGGCAHIPGGLSALPEGALAVECPACPHPDRNMDLSKETLVTRPPMFETLYLSMDANFKLKQKERGFVDPPLANGYAYMVSNKRLLDHLAECNGKKDLKDGAVTCGSNFHAINDAHTKLSSGYAVTGVGGVDCARHGFKRPCGVVDLQKGERYVNMDLAFLLTLLIAVRAGIKRVVISYDIACQWAKFLEKRLSMYSASLFFKLSSLAYWCALIPKFYLAGHGKDCQLRFNINYTKGAARMTGEMIESGWAQSGSMAISTRENGPFARRAILDDHWGAENWRKLRRLRTSFLKNLKHALIWSKTQRTIADNASQRLHSETLTDWIKMRQEFDRDTRKPNPYEEPETFVTMVSLRRQLDEEEARDVRLGRTPPHAVTASVFMGDALQLEGQQLDIRLKEQEAIKADTTAGGSTERRKHLVESIRVFRAIQKVYMPGLSHLLDHADDDSRLDTHPDLFKLMLPSQLSSEDRQSWCLPGLPTLEARFRYAQADDALAELCRLRRLFQGLSDQNRKHITTSQGTTTRGKGTFDRYKARISRAAAVYRHARRALVALDPNGAINQWTTRFLELKDADIRGPGRDDDEPSEGRTVSSWIWLVPNASHGGTGANSDGPNLSQRAASGEELVVSIRAHWARCQARAERYEEEVELTVEEMRRTLDFFAHKSRWWLELQDKRTASDAPPDPQVQHGLRAYAHRQASMYSSLISTYVDHWREFLVEHSLGLDWLDRYPTTQPPTTEPVSTGGMDGVLEGEEDEGEEEGTDPEEPADPEFEEIYADLSNN